MGRLADLMSFTSHIVVAHCLCFGSIVLFAGPGRPEESSRGSGSANQRTRGKGMLLTLGGEAKRIHAARHDQTGQRK